LFVANLASPLARWKHGLALRPAGLTFIFPSGSVCCILQAMNARLAKFSLGQVVRHRIFPFRGVIFDVDPVFANTEEYWLSIPEAVRPHKDQPFYHLLAENDQSSYVAYVSEQNLLADDSGEPVGHPQTALIFDSFQDGQYHMRPRVTH
jgi:heat shock protein HspQ